MIKRSAKLVKVTVAMPAYNSSKYIQEAIESILAQSYDDFELLIIDDCSKDNTWQLIQRYKSNPRIRLYKNINNLGVGSTRNKLVALAYGKYISPCDSDDIMLQGNLKRLAEFLDTHSKIGVVYSDFLVTGSHNKKMLMDLPFIFGKDCNKTWDILENAINHAGSMIRKELIKSVGGYDEDGIVDDYSLWLKLSEVTKFKYLPGEIYYVYRQRENSLSSQKIIQLRNSRIKISEAIKRRYRYDFKF